LDTRKTYWYSIIKYIADFTKGEPLNIGIFIENSQDNSVLYSLLEPDNTKLKSVFENRLQRDVYKYSKDYFDYLISQVKNNNYPLEISSNSLINYFSKDNDLPRGFVLSEPQFAKTVDVNILKRNLEITYIGEKFLHSESTTRELVIKERAHSIFSEANLLNNKVKTNVKISPLPDLPFKYQIDFAYSVKDKIELIQSAPGSIDLLPDWFEKITVFSTKYALGDKISLLFDSSVEEELLNDTRSVIRTLTNHDEKIQAVDINVSLDGMNRLVEDINKNAQDVTNLEKLLAS